KPANFVKSFPNQDDPHPLKMIDFGIAKFIGEDVAGRPLDNFTKVGEFVGPQNWSSPELIAYADDKTVVVDQRSDLYQLGLLIWFFFTGR
ncbi:hypothetical protein ABTM49_19755, partial [Acinetobacter baumannii]